MKIFEVENAIIKELERNGFRYFPPDTGTSYRLGIPPGPDFFAVRYDVVASSVSMKIVYTSGPCVAEMVELPISQNPRHEEIASMVELFFRSHPQLLLA